MQEDKNQVPGNEQNKKWHSPKPILAVLCVIAVALLMLAFDSVSNLFMSIASILTPVLLGCSMAYILNPLCTAIEKRLLPIFSKSRYGKEKNVAKALAVLVSVLLFILIIALLLFLVIPEFVSNFLLFIDKIPSLISDINHWIDAQSRSDNVFLANIGSYLNSVVNWVSNWLETGLSDMLNGVLSAATSFVGFLFDFLVAIVVCVYALLGKKRFIIQAKKIVIAYFSPKRANSIFECARYGHEVFGKYISGKLLTSLIVGLVTFIFMTIMRMPYALLSAVILGITNVIPYFGPFIGGIPTAFFVLITDVKLGIIYILFMLVLQQIEGNIIEPAIMEDKTGLGKFWIVFALLVFGGLFGVVGMIISVPAFAIVYYLIKLRVNGALEAKSLPVDNDSYLNIKGIDESSNKLIVSEHNAPGGFWIAARKRIKVQAEERRKRKAEKKKNKK